MDDLRTTLSEQRRELMAAKALDSDLDLAYQLQMQEAMNASLALQTSTSSSSPPPPHLPNDVVTESSNDDVLDVAARLMLEDMERFVQELEDRQQSEAEMRKMKEDLDRRIHDQKFAAYILNVPDKQWELYGDNYNSPYRTSKSSSSASSSSSSSSTALIDTECFRLYFKGLVSEERVRGMKVIVAGAGVAICDPKDNLVLETRKNLEAFMEGVTLTIEVAQLEALIEALNKALTLGLKRLTFFCDDYMLYQYVTGRVIPQQSRIATLVNRVALLRRNFLYCSPSLVARNDIKFAFKSARDAIVSQIAWREETNNGKGLKETCVICFEDTDVDKIFSVDGCLHRYCFSCMKQHVEVKLLNGMVAKCPHENCKSEVNIDSCGKLLASNLVQVMSQRIKESSISPAEKVYCPYPRSNPNPHPEDAKLKSLAKTNRWRQCLKCNHMVELAEGCYHITCRCGYEFCYTCGAEWKNKKATCTCRIWDERNIIHDHGLRR
uniref:RBR-type E3 ubiquitin transferase n=1 Tax=Fagus sylvatica TaxID=28930 RepID=A0A2N9FSW1_FAGSY